MKKRVWSIMIMLLLILTACGKKDIESSQGEIGSELAETESETEEQTESEMTGEPIIETESQVADVPEAEENTDTETIINSEGMSETTEETNQEPEDSEINNSETTETEEIMQDVVKDTWFGEQGFTFTALTEDFCPNNDSSHDCNMWFEIYQDVEDCEEGYRHEYIVFPNKNTYYEGYRVEAFDMYTGTYFDFCSTLEDGYIPVEYNGETISILFGGGSPWEGVVTMDIFCPIDYDGVVFALVPRDCVEMPKASEYGTKVFKIDEIVDFTQGGYYFFRYSE